MQPSLIISTCNPEQARATSVPFLSLPATWVPRRSSDGVSVAPAFDITDSPAATALLPRGFLSGLMGWVPAGGVEFSSKAL